jgi:hypothetical protein
VDTQSAAIPNAKIVATLVATGAQSVTNTGLDGQFTIPFLSRSVTPDNRERVEPFFSVASCFEAWVNRRKSEHTRRAYRGDVMAFVQFMGWRWPKESMELALGG